MDKTTLVGPDLDEGRKFLELLRQSHVKVNASLWQRDEIMEQWSLVIVTPLVDELGVKGTYRRLMEVLDSAAERPRIDLLDVSVYTPKASFYKSLRHDLGKVRERAIRKGPVGDHIVDEGFVYFVK